MITKSLTKSQGKNLFRPDIKKSAVQFIINELHRLLAEYRSIDEMFRERHKMDFNKFKSKQGFETSYYSFNFDEDYYDWEAAIDGIHLISAELKDLDEQT